VIYPPEGLAHSGGIMETNWQLNRSFVEQLDGQRRWDYVYQYLLQWVMEQTADAPSAPTHLQEKEHGNRDLCARVNAASTTTSDH
jgi:hypothetical protein